MFSGTALSAIVRREERINDSSINGSGTKLTSNGDGIGICFQNRNSKRLIWYFNEIRRERRLQCVN